MVSFILEGYYGDNRIISFYELGKYLHQRLTLRSHFDTVEVCKSGRETSIIMSLSNLHLEGKVSIESCTFYELSFCRLTFFIFLKESNLRKTSG